jgi:OFA family oxalate/formate antiporter-like MFS transporter
MLAGYKWLPQSKGLVSGGILAGYGLGGFFFNLIGTSLVNPNGLNPVGGKFTPEIYANFPKMLRKLSVIYIVLSLIGSLLVTEPIVAPVDLKNEKVVAKPVEIPGVTVSQALHSSQFWQLWILIVSAASCGLNIANIYKQFAGNSKALAGDSFQALVGGLGAVFNGSGRLFWGAISDKIGIKASFLILTLLQSVLQLVYPLGTNSKVNEI